MATRTAAHRVFGVGELHELILLYLDPVDLARARRVAVVWNTMILSSKRIRICTFFEPDHITEGIVYSPKPQIIPPTSAPLAPDTHAYVLATLHPALVNIAITKAFTVAGVKYFHKRGPQHDPFPDHRFHGPLAIRMTSPSQTELQINPTALLRWALERNLENAFVTQPPFKEVQGRVYGRIGTADVRSEKGFTIGELSRAFGESDVRMIYVRVEGLLLQEAVWACRARGRAPPLGIDY